MPTKMSYSELVEATSTEDLLSLLIHSQLTEVQDFLRDRLDNNMEEWSVERDGSCIVMVSSGGERASVSFEAAFYVCWKKYGTAETLATFFAGVIKARVIKLVEDGVVFMGVVGRS